MIAVLRQWSSSARTAVGDLAERPDRLRLALEIGLAVVLAVQAVWLIWVLFSPRAQASAPGAPAAGERADTTIFQRFDAFFRTGAPSSTAEDVATSGSQMRLYGVRAGGAGGGSAIVGLADGRQVSVGVGEEVEPGLILQSVGEDHIVLSRGGSLSRLVFAEIPQGVTPTPAPPPTPQVVTPPTPAPAAPDSAANAPVVDPARLAGQAALRPRMNGLRVNGFTVSAAGDGAALRAAGLQSGDVILAVNGNELNSLQGAAGLRRDLSNATSAEIRYERDGQVRTTTIRTGR